MNTPTTPMTADDEIYIDGLLRVARKRIDEGAAQHGEPWAQGGRAAVNFIEHRVARVMHRKMAAVYAERDALLEIAEMTVRNLRHKAEHEGIEPSSLGRFERALYEKAVSTLARSKGGAS